MKVPKVFVCNFQIIAMTKICITFYQVTPDITSYHTVSLLITSCHTLSTRLETKHFHLATLKLVSRLLISYHIIPRLVTTYHTISPRLETKPFSLGNFKISSQALNFLSYLIMPCHSLSHLITPYPQGWKQNIFI